MAGKAILSDEQGGDPLAHRCKGIRFFEDLPIMVAMRINEPWGNNFSLGIYFFSSCSIHSTNIGDQIAIYCNITPKARLSSTIYDRSIPYHYIMFIARITGSEKDK